MIMLIPQSTKEGRAVWKILLVIAGALVTIAGVVWTLQGAGLIGGSSMTGVKLWILIGPIVALGGLAMAATGLRHR
jgi:hypothetical protein